VNGEKQLKPGDGKTSAKVKGYQKYKKKLAALLSLINFLYKKRLKWLKIEMGKQE
jgi:hypothetical protein